MSSIEYSNSSRRLGAIAAELASDAIKIPPHQRDYVWSIRQQVKLVDAVQAGMPMPNITLRNQRNGSTILTTLEDGQQRLTTLRRYMDSAFRDGRGRLFSQLSEVERMRFESYTVNVMTYSNATDEEAIIIFNNLQNGSSCSIGERIFSLAHISPLVQYTLDMLLTPGKGFYDRTVPFWGERTPRGQRGKYMTEAFAICAGLAHGSQYISKKWSDIEEVIAPPFDRDELTRNLEFIVSLYESVHQDAPVTTKKLKTMYWSPSNFTAYIVHSLKLTTELEPVHQLPTREQIGQTFRTFMLEQRLHPEILAERLHASDVRGNERGGGHWSQSRWHNGWRRMFAPGAELDDISTVDSDADDVE